MVPIQFKTKLLICIVTTFYCLGKFIEQVRKYLNLFVALNERSFMRRSRSPYLKATKIIANQMAFLFLQRSKVYLNKPLAVGCSILDLSKFIMAQAFYKDFLPRWPTLKVIMSDTGEYTCIHLT